MKGLSDTSVESVIRAFAKGKMTARQAAAHPRFETPPGKGCRSDTPGG